MTKSHHILDDFDVTPAILEREWVLTSDTPVGGVEAVITALRDELPLTQGPFDNCMFVRDSGHQRFRTLEGSHAGGEGTIQKTAAQHIVIS